MGSNAPETVGGRLSLAASLVRLDSPCEGVAIPRLLAKYHLEYLHIPALGAVAPASAGIVTDVTAAVSPLPERPSWPAPPFESGWPQVSGKSRALLPALLFAIPLAVVAAAAPVLQAIKDAADACVPSRRHGCRNQLGVRALNAASHLLQPIARLHGRLTHGLTSWRRRDSRKLAVPEGRPLANRTEEWEPPEAKPARLEAELRAGGRRSGERGPASSTPGASRCAWGRWDERD
jgi:hypothetical protein